MNGDDADQRFLQPKTHQLTPAGPNQSKDHRPTAVLPSKTRHELLPKWKLTQSSNKHSDKLRSGLTSRVKSAISGAGLYTQRSENHSDIDEAGGLIQQDSWELLSDITGTDVPEEERPDGGRFAELPVRDAGRRDTMRQCTRSSSSRSWITCCKSFGISRADRAS
ncbi:hypothetical protein EYF80_012950 [Liparis tanakae]|uniref:Uncharacterized protein n=1 Tax=Liparis tanakae TaxID=230148 RepID=A0A4Z2IGI4_9TELE|nr:hypothetical protein EYF80_012950 [Liparis tanakae]